MTLTISDRPKRFAFETELVETLRPALPRTLFPRKVSGRIEVFSEVPARIGIPDLTVIRFKPEILQLRHVSSIEPLETVNQIAIALALESGSLSLELLSRKVALPTNLLRNAILPQLRDSGWVVFSNQVEISRRPEAIWAHKKIITIEAKLKDWSGGIAQARRQSLSSDESYIALDAANSEPIKCHIEGLATRGLGVLLAEAERGKVTLVSRPVPNAPDKNSALLGKALIAERCIAMEEKGIYRGEIFPVFGK